jgi:prepilin-type N-terminal cleavage/methylation domain-containing protein
MGIRRNGFTLIEAIISLVMLAILILGASLYRYGCAMDSRKASVDMLANRTGLLLLESWHGSYATTFNPTDAAQMPVSGTVVVATGSGPGAPDGTYTTLGNYTVTVNSANTSLSNIKFYITLSSKDGGGGLKMKILNMNMRYSQQGIASASLADSGKALSLTTYKFY